MSNGSQKVAFIGLGVMGYHMAGHLAKAGHEVTVYNRTGARAEQWLAEFSGHQAGTPEQAVNGAAMVFCCVGNDADRGRMHPDSQASTGGQIDSRMDFGPGQAMPLRAERPISKL